MPKIKELNENIKLRSIYLGISETCNASCSFCYRDFYNPKPKGFMSNEVFDSILTQIRQIDSIKNISLTVAESTMHPRFDDFSIRLNQNKTYKTTIVTNMSLAHRHFEALMLYDGIVMSIEGFDKKSYENSRKGLKWDVVRSNVKILDEYIRRNKGNSPKRKINFIVDKSSDIREFVNVWGDYTDIIMIDPMLPQTIWTNGRNALKKTSEYLFSFVNSDEIICTEPFYRLGILADGSVKPCGTRMYEQKDYGNYINLNEAFNNQKNILHLRKCREKNNMRGCKNCRHSLKVNEDEWQYTISKYEDLIKGKNVVFAKGLKEVNGGIWQKNL